MSINDFGARLATTGLPWYVARTLSWFLAFNTLVTGWDYLHTPSDAAAARSLSMVIRLWDLHTWGSWYIAGGLLLLLGLTIRRHFVVWLGHFLLAGMYAGFTVATFQGVWVAMHSPMASQLGSIWRAVSTSVVITLLHIVLCYIRGPIPRRGDER